MLNELRSEFHNRRKISCTREKGRQYTYNVTMGRVRAIIDAVEKQ